MTHDDANRILFHVLETVECSLCVFEVALSSTQLSELEQDWRQTLSETRATHHLLLDAFEALGLDAGEESAARRLVRYRAQALIDLMHMTRRELSSPEAEVIAADVFAEIRHKLALNLSELERIGTRGPSDYTDALRAHGLIGSETGRFSSPPDPHWFALPTHLLEARERAAE